MATIRSHQLSIGIVGLPNSGKSTVFNALTKASVPAENYPFCTIEKNVGVVKVPDQTLPQLAKIFKSAKTVPAAIKFIDIAGLVKGAHKGEGLGNKFLGHIREVDAIMYVLRAFQREDVTHPHPINPADDLIVVRTELELKDLETGENVLSKKPAFYVINTSSASDKTELPEDVNKDFVLKVDCRTEAELDSFSAEEQKDIISSIKDYKGVANIIKMAYKLLDLITFYSGNEKETNAWAIKNGSTAIEAAGVVHSDFAGNFVNAEVIQAKDMIKADGWQNGRDKGIVRTEGRDYIVADQDCINFISGQKVS